MNVLIVDDCAAMRRTMRDFTADFFEDVLECEDGGAAFALYETHLPDWVLMDIEMKPVDGICATRQIVAAFPKAKIAIVTNYDDTEMREASFAAGACEYIAKDNLIDLRRLFARQNYETR